jgi:hypothetical protein
VQRIWRAFGLQPHRVETFKLLLIPLDVAHDSGMISPTVPI